MNSTLGLLLTLVLADPAKPPPDSVKLDKCLVSLIDDVKVSAEEAGKLINVEVREGMNVSARMLLATIDDRRVQMQKRVIEFQHRQAKVQADNDVNVRFSQVAAKVADAEHQESLEANKIAPRAVAATEVRRLLLNAQKSTLAIEQAQLELTVARLASDTKAAELDVAKLEIVRRQVVAPISGVVVDVHKRMGEWVNPGDPIVRIVRMDHLRVEGFVNLADFGDEEFVGRSVRVTVRRQRGQTAEFRGKIVFVNPLIESAGQYRVWAEVDNRLVNDRWLLRPGMEAQMVIELNSAPASK